MAFQSPKVLSVVIVSWNTRALLCRCLDSLRDAKGDLELEIIVVDNGSRDGTVEMLRTSFPEVILVEPGENSGFSRGNNIGLEHARGEWMLLLNPDTEVAPGSLSTLVHFLDAHPYVGVVAPQLFYADGCRQSTRRRFPTLLTLFFESTSLQRLLGPLQGHYYMKEKPPEVAHTVDWLMGAALLVRREVYESVGGFDERFFMYFEETDWQRRIKAAGWSIWYLPSATIIHHEAASSRQVVALRHIRFNTSRILYTRKWHGAFWARLLRAWLLALYGVEWWKEAAKWLLGHKRLLRARRLQEYRLVLASGLSGTRRVE